jgi:hypothetical protein
MTKTEYAILGRLAKRLRAEHLETWRGVRYQTQFGPESWNWPYYPAALDLIESAKGLVRELPTGEKQRLLDEWASKPERPDQGVPDAIFARCGVIVLDIFIARAKAAGQVAQF